MKLCFVCVNVCTVKEVNCLCSWVKASFAIGVNKNTGLAWFFFKFVIWFDTVVIPRKGSNMVCKRTLFWVKYMISIFISFYSILPDRIKNKCSKVSQRVWRRRRRRRFYYYESWWVRYKDTLLDPIQASRMYAIQVTSNYIYNSQHNLVMMTSH